MMNMKRMTFLLLLVTMICVGTFGLTGTAHANASFRIMNSVGGYNTPKSVCLGINGGSTSNGALTIVWSCNGNSDQTWISESFPPNPTNYIRLKNSKSGLCLGLQGGIKAEGATPIQWTCNNNNDQAWHPEGIGSSLSFLKNLNSGLCLGVYGPVKSGAWPVQWACNGNADQNWYLY